MNRNGSFYFKKRYNTRLPYYFVLFSVVVPIGVAYNFGQTTRKLEDGVKKDLVRIQAKGKKFSDIPKSF